MLDAVRTVPLDDFPKSADGAFWLISPVQLYALANSLDETQLASEDLRTTLSSLSKTMIALFPSLRGLGSVQKMIPIRLKTDHGAVVHVKKRSTAWTQPVSGDMHTLEDWYRLMKGPGGASTPMATQPQNVPQEIDGQRSERSDVGAGVSSAFEPAAKKRRHDQDQYSPEPPVYIERKKQLQRKRTEEGQYAHEKERYRKQKSREGKKVKKKEEEGNSKDV